MASQIDTVVAAVRADLLRRSELGIAKYGVTLDRTDLNLRDWLQHAYEETLDQANYLKRAIIEFDETAAPTATLAKIYAAIEHYHAALTARKHGGVAADRLVSALQEITGKHWNG